MSQPAKLVTDHVLDALDVLSVALAGHNHQWTTAERKVYERAVRLLTVGYPLMQQQLLKRAH